MWNQINLSKGEITMNYAKIMENGTVRISSIKKEGYKPLKEEKPEGFSNLVFVGYTETEEFVIKEYEAVDDGMSAYGKLQKDLKATQTAQEVTDQAVQELILATMKMGV